MKPWLKEICDQVEDGTALPARIDDALAVFRRWGFDEDAPLFTMAGELVAMLIERCEQQDAELSRLRTLEAALPKTADGVPVVPGSGSRLWYIHPDSHTIYERSYTADMRDARSHWIGDHQERHDVVWIGVEQCYSTREAAEAAREAEKARNA